MIKRLTERDEYGNADIIGVDSAELQLNLEFDELNRVTDALNRLAGYEDSGLSPEEVKALRQENEQCKAGKGKIGKWPVEIGTLFMGLKIVGADYRRRTIEIEWKEKEGE